MNLLSYNSGSNRARNFESDFEITRHYSLNCTPLGPVTITNNNNSNSNNSSISNNNDNDSENDNDNDNDNNNNTLFYMDNIDY